VSGKSDYERQVEKEYEESRWREYILDELKEVVNLLTEVTEILKRIEQQ
jgi:hypothetical protein